MTHNLLIGFLTIITSLGISAQESHENPYHSHEHEHHKNEIGIANSAVYFVKEKVYSYGLHVHYTRTISETKFGVGAAYERIFDPHGHNTFGVALIYSPFEKFNINLSPGLTFEDENPSDVGFALHLETSYEFEINNFHLGPSLEFAYDPEDYHISLGLHIGYGF